MYGESSAHHDEKLDLRSQVTMLDMDIEEVTDRM
jgi:hypothetical protein